MSVPPSQIYEFGDFRLDSEKRLLWRNGSPVSLTPRVFDTLLFMVENPNGVLDKERLMEAVWPDSIVEENNLTQNISTLRRIFGETPGSHRYIVTIPGRGYRFVAKVRAASAGEQSAPPAVNGATQLGIPHDSFQEAQSPPAKKISFVKIGFAVVLLSALIGTVIFAFQMRKRPPLGASTAKSFASERTQSTNSIAVLPFENLSADSDNANLAMGIQEEILSNLAKISDLKVISRTSANLYKTGSPRNAQEIGQQLGVAHLLEGSVQRLDKRLRVHAQLIDARTDSHLWAQTYNRDLADLFAIQSEIAQAIADQLKVKISEQERASINRPPTSDLIANALYVQALEIESKVPDYQNLPKAVELLEQAVARDPQFLLAHCALAQIHLDIYMSGRDHTISRREKAEAAIQEAIRVQPDAAEVHLVQARYFGLYLGDYDRARVELDLARRILPNDPAVYYHTALIDRRQGRWTEALQNLERALELDPRNARRLGDAASTYGGVRRYSDATRLYNRALAITPRDHWLRIFGTSLVFDEFADIAPMRAELNAILAEEPDAGPKIAESLFECAIFERDSDAVDRALAFIPQEGITAGPELVLPREWYVGIAARTFNRTETARAAFETTRTVLESLVSQEPDHALAWSILGRVQAALGRREEAIRSGRRACEILPLSREATSGRRPLRNLIKIYTWAGEKDLALEQLERSALEPLMTSYGELRLDPEWDPLRGDPRFDQIAASLAPKNKANQ